MSNLHLLLKNINNYGFVNFLKMIFYEIYYSAKLLNVKTLTYEEINNDNYFKTKNNKEYNTPYIPTPYYFLSEIDNFFNNNKINNYLLVDLGCGYSRTNLFFKNNFNLFLGIDYNLKIIKYLNKKKFEKSFFFYKNLRSDKNISFLLSQIDKFKRNKKVVLFFSDSFELSLLKKIILKLKKKIVFYCVIVNLKDKHFLKTNEKIIFKKIFLNKNRNIFIFKLF